MLSDIEIKNAMDVGEITIFPYDSKCLGASRYEVHLGTKLLIPRGGQLIDLREQKEKIEYEERILYDDGYILEPKSFVLGQTSEQIAMNAQIGMFIDGRSTLARIGLSIHQSATTLLPGQESHIVTLELFNCGNNRIVLYPDIKIGKLIFFRTCIPNSSNHKGLYLGQKETTGPRLN